MGCARKVFDEMFDKSEILWIRYKGRGCGYVKMECIGLTRELFDEMKERNVISWTSMVSRHYGDVENARLMFDLMSKNNLYT
ncbi:hypothetical protein Fmac_029673 [Flemingia macrophylla]|uniref:Pentatricopeptide repeat-containing protein n=1 Tax=Flemingia macrophylla TaxID=520843 RepID=A0ABD1LB17_9FABA